MSVYVGIDVGDARIGIAVSDAEKNIAFPLTVINRKDNSYGFNKLREILKDRQVEAFIIGLPIKSDGSLGVQGEKVLFYAKSLEEYFQIKVITWDERFTTVIAGKYLSEGKMKSVKKKMMIDEIAAQVILQSFLDSQKRQP